MEDGEDLEFETLEKELCPKISSTDSIDFNSQMLTAEPISNVHMR